MRRLFYLSARCHYLGDFEVFVAYLSALALGVAIYCVINCLTFKEFLGRFGVLKIARRDFYECGFRPQTQRPVRLSMQFLLICAFFLVYDVELVFLFPYVAGATHASLYDFIMLSIFFFLFAISLLLDYERNALY